MMKHLLLPRLSVSLLVVIMLMIVSWFALPQQIVRAAAFTTGNLVVYRVGNGSAAISGAVPVFLDEFSTTAVPANPPVQSIALPTTASGANKRLVAAASGFEGLITRSVNGEYLLLTGYDADVDFGGTDPSTLTTAVVNRVVGRVDASGQIDTTTALTDTPDGSNIRTAASTDGTNIWVGGSAGGVRYTTLGNTISTQLNTSNTATRQLNIFDGQLYASVSATVAVGTVGIGLPTLAPQTITALPGVTSGNAFGYVLADLDAGVAGVDTLYVTDDLADKISKFSLVGGTWTANGAGVTVPGAGPAVRGLIGSVTGTTVSLYGTTTTALFSLIDTSGYNAPLTGTAITLATAASNTAFRGLAFAPNNAPAATAVPTAVPTTTPITMPVLPFKIYLPLIARS